MLVQIRKPFYVRKHMVRAVLKSPWILAVVLKSPWVLTVALKSPWILALVFKSPWIWSSPWKVFDFFIMAWKVLEIQAFVFAQPLFWLLKWLCCRECIHVAKLRVCKSGRRVSIFLFKLRPWKFFLSRKSPFIYFCTNHEAVTETCAMACDWERDCVEMRSSHRPDRSKWY